MGLRAMGLRGSDVKRGFDRCGGPDLLLILLMLRLLIVGRILVHCRFVANGGAD